MSYAARNLSVLSYANGFTMWHYSTPDKMEAVLSDGYFNDASHLVRKGDMIVTNTNTQGDLVQKNLIVTNSKGGTVSVSTHI